MTIYEKLQEELVKNPALDVFARELELGKEEIQRVLTKKEEQSEAWLALPDFESYPLVSFKSQIGDFVASETNACVKIEKPPEQIDADLAIPCFSLMAKGKETVAKLADGIKAYPFVADTSVVGGYINVQLKADVLVQETLAVMAEQGNSYGASNDGAKKLVVMDYSHPNISKPMSFGHLRSTIIGASLKRIYEFCGFHVVGVNHLGDFGTQFGKLLYAFSQWKDEQAFAKEPMKEMLRLYVKFHEEAKQNPELEEKGREMFQRLEKGDAKLVEQWIAFCLLSIKDFQKTYDALGMNIDLALGESFYETMLADTLKKLLDKTIAVQNEDGSVAVNFADESLPSFLLKKKDGSSLYILRDVAAAGFRLQAFQPETIIYVVGAEQTLHFRQLFKTLGLLGYNVARFRHDPFGLVSLPEGKMSTREGRVVFLEDVLAEAKTRARAIAEEKNSELSESEKEKIAEAVGVGAVIYSDLSQSREKNIVFSWERAMSLDGDSAPYIQYGYARAASIMRKAGVEVTLPERMSKLNEREKKLVRLLARFPEVVAQAREHDAPHIIAGFLNTLTQEFNRFYAQDPVLTADEQTKNSRLALVRAVAQVLKNGLSLLGIGVLERM
ncbi:MAG: arginine--tRNA ligase [Patescibacteria group bacterium]